MRKTTTIALSLDNDIVAELRRISDETDAPMSRIANRHLTSALLQKQAKK